ncbi:hypothetical protein FGG08_001939 [Glutinoglossum americanum]|uniref:phosphoserine phosphatase n=1 Tax=Glutinoglossum americanum TaxID=1670608 RepID=A0A9P8IAK8_9PEZI|nr:hypothetical protein FGG08_001939 [Glutinoglossum americanum]
MSHRSCQPGPDEPGKLVATLFYNSRNPRHPHIHPDSIHSGDPDQLPPQPLLLAGAAPTIDMANYPLEPPPPEPEPLDHLYGPYISQICLAHFLQILNELQNPYQRITSSHRCLDSQVHPRVMEITFSPPPNPDYISFDELRRHESIWRFEREWNVEVVLQKEEIWRKHKRLAVFDMDSTLIQQEVVDEIARVVGVEKEVSAITARAMNGELDFGSSLRARVTLLKGVPADVFERLKSVVTVTPGAREVCKSLKRLGYKLAVLSGGFTPLAQWLADDLGINYVFANNLVVSEDGKTLTGELTGPVVDKERKAFLLEEIAGKENIPLKQVLAVGDGANDLLMLDKAGLGIAFNAKPIVQLEVWSTLMATSIMNSRALYPLRYLLVNNPPVKAPSRLNSESLADILYVLGFTKDEQEALLEEEDQA